MRSFGLNAGVHMRLHQVWQLTIVYGQVCLVDCDM